MKISPQYIASMVTGSVASLALFAVLYSGIQSTESVKDGGATLQVASAATEEPRDTGGRLGELAPEFDMGVIDNKEKTVKSLKLTNTGSGKLNIKDVKTSCGCTKGYFKDRKGDLMHSLNIPPGESVDLYISVDPARVPGFDSRKSVTIFTTDPGNAAATFDVLAKVKPEFEIVPEQLHLGELTKGVKADGQAIIRQLEPGDFDVTAVRPGARATDIYTVALHPRPESDWQTPDLKEWTISVELDSSGLRRELFRDRLYVETTCERLPTYSYMLNAQIDTFFSLIPEMLHRRDAVEPGTSGVASAVVTADKPIQIQDLSVSNPALTAAVNQEDPGGSAVLELSVAPDAEPGVKTANVSFTIVAEDGTRAEENLRAIVAVK